MAVDLVDVVDAADVGMRDLPRDAHFVAPELVVQVAFTEWTSDGRLRHPVMLGRRDDVDPLAVRRELPVDQTGESSSSNSER